MCFHFDRTVLTSDRTVAWKCVIQKRGFLYSWWNDNFWYGPGEVRAGLITLTYGEKARFANARDDQRAEAGIYVFTSLKEAQKSRGLFEVILKVEVDPADFLGQCCGGATGKPYFHSRPKGYRAVYKKVFVPEKQPFFDWA